MSRKIHLINQLKRIYLECQNIEKDKFILDCMNNIKALTIKPEVKNE